jgi:CRP-like cAMP-binding protein
MSLRHDTVLMEPPHDQLRGLPILRDASPAALDRVAAAASWRSYAPGELILDAHDASSEVWFVLEGSVRILVRTSAGREMILSELGPGDMFGEVAAIDSAPRTAGASALARSRLCKVPAPAFLEAACSTPAASLALLRWMTGILRRQSHRSLEREALPVRLRLCAELLRLSRPRANPGEGNVVSPPPPHHVLAARINSRREVVSRELGELAREGLVLRTRGGLVLPRPGELRYTVEAEMEAGATP